MGYLQLAGGGTVAKREIDLGAIIGPRWLLPELYFDVDTATLYRGPANTGYDFKVVDAVIYYKEKP